MSDPIFVIHLHETEKIHYDLRLEIDGKLLSWALGKGLSTDPAVRRMGIKIEDQHLDMANYEGKISEEKYGTGQAIIWDKGTYKNIREELDGLDMVSALEDGHIKVFLDGKKLRGGFTLIDVPYGRTKWLQVKERDEYIDEANDIMKLR